MKNMTLFKILLLVLITNTTTISATNTEETEPKTELLGWKTDAISKSIKELAKFLSLNVALDCAIDELKDLYRDLYSKLSPEDKKKMGKGKIIIRVGFTTKIIDTSLILDPSKFKNL